MSVICIPLFGIYIHLLPRCSALACVNSVARDLHLGNYVSYVA